MLIVQSGIDASSVRPIVPPKFGSGIGSTLRSGLNFPIASASDPFSAATPCLSVSTTERIAAPASACSTPNRCSSSNTAMIPAEPGGRFSPILSWISCSTRWSTNLPITPPATAPTPTDASSGGANTPTARPTPAPQPAPLRPSPVARLPHSDRAVLRVRDEDHALDRNLLLLHERDERLEVRRRRVDVLVPGDQDVGRFLCHRASFRPNVEVSPRPGGKPHPLGVTCSPPAETRAVYERFGAATAGRERLREVLVNDTAAGDVRFRPTDARTDHDPADVRSSR